MVILYMPEDVLFRLYGEKRYLLADEKTHFARKIYFEFTPYA